MAAIVVLMMEGGAERPELTALRQAGHSLTVVEPRWPECRRSLEGRRPGLLVVDGTRAPSHGRAVGAWMAGQAGLRTVPVLFLDVPDRDVARTKKEVPRAQFATWSSLASTAGRLAKGQP